MSDRREFVVYLSSTLADLVNEREVALKTIAEVGVVRTSYRADEQGAVAACQGDVRQSHLYVGILGQRYGYVPPKAENNPQDKSITELEYEACAVPNGTSIPRLMFIKSTEGGISGAHIDALSNPQTAQRMADFLQRANSDQVAFMFKNIEEFRAELRIRVRDKADRFHLADTEGRGIFGGNKRWRRQLAPIGLACVPGTDEAQRAAFATLGDERFMPFEVSPNDPNYLATLDAGLARAQVGALLITPASLARCKASEGVDNVRAGMAMMIERTGTAFLITEGVEDGAFPPQWQLASRLPLPSGSLTAPNAAATLADLYERLRALTTDLTLEPRLALPYMVIAPTLDQVTSLLDPAGNAYSAFGDEAVRRVRKSEFQHIAAASRVVDPEWPKDMYGSQHYHWRCFGARLPGVEDIIRESIKRVNSAAPGSREKRFLRTAQLCPRAYRLEEYLNDRLGSKQAIIAVRDSGCLFVVDEIALLQPQLREAAETLLVGPRTAIVAVTSCDPLHSRIDALLGDFSFLRVGSLITRFKTELDPRCEIALNNIGRMQRWLRTTLPELVVTGEDQESVPALADQMARMLAQ